MEDLKVQGVKINYIQKEVKSISKKLDKFIDDQDRKFLNFVRADVLNEVLSNINGTIKLINDQQVLAKQKLEEHDDFMPMIKDIKKERESIKFKIIDIVGKVAFWIILFGLGIQTFAK